MANGKGPGGQGGGSQGGGSQGGQAGEQDNESWQSMMQDRVNRLASQVQSQSSQLGEMAGGGIREWPMSSVLGALAIGAAIGFVLGRSS